MRLRPKLLLFVVLITLAPLTLYGGWAILLAVRGAEQGVTEGTRTAAVQSAGRVGAFLRGREDVLRAIAAGLPREGGDDGASIPILRRALLENATLRYLALTDQGGNLRASTLLPAPGVSKQVAQAARTALASGEPARSEVILTADLLPVMAVAVPVFRAGRVTGALAAEVETLELWAVVQGIELGETGYAYLVDRQSRLFAHGQPRELAYTVLAEPYPAPAVVAQVGVAPVTVRHQRADGVEVVAAAAAVPGADWVMVVEAPVVEAFAGARRLRRALALILALALALSAAVGVLGARSLLRPVESLAGAVRRVGEGDFGVHVEVDRTDELGDLGRGFNAMSRALAGLTEEIRRQERHAFFGRIAGGLAHDLKRPFQHLITHVRTYLELPGSERARGNLERSLDREQAYVDRLFSDLADFASPQPVHHAAVDVTRLLARVTDALAAHAAEAGCTVEADECAASVRVSGDAMTLERALRNLGENALDAMEDRPGRLRFRVECEGDAVLLVVEDEGPGIAPALLPEIFDAFRTTKRSGGGLGLGLPVVRRIVEDHEGTIQAEARPEGGTRFVLRLPRHRAADRSSAA